MHPFPLIASTIRLLTACVLGAILTGTPGVAMVAPLAKTTSWGSDQSASGRFADAPPTEHDCISIAEPSGYESAPSRTTWLSRDPIGEDGGVNLYQYVYDNPLGWIDPEGLSGELTINSNGDGGSSSTSGHSWICYKPDGGPPTTFGTWGNNPSNLGNGLQQNLEQGRTGETSRSTHLDDSQEQQLANLINKYKNLGEKGWTLTKTCSSFASDAWKAGTGEKLSTGFPSTPSTLKKSIKKANGGNNNGKK